jgi:hypothetical protein
MKAAHSQWAGFSRGSRSVISASFSGLLEEMECPCRLGSGCIYLVRKCICNRVLWPGKGTWTMSLLNVDEFNQQDVLHSSGVFDSDSDDHQDGPASGDTLTSE